MRPPGLRKIDALQDLRTDGTVHVMHRGSQLRAWEIVRESDAF